MSAYDSQVVGVVNALRINARQQYQLNGNPLGTGDLANSAGFVNASQVQADWLETSTLSPNYIFHKPTLAAVATSGSASDITTGQLPVGVVPQLPAQQISSGNFQIGNFAVNVAPTVDGSQNLGMGGLRWKTLYGLQLALNKSLAGSAQLDVAGQGAIAGVNPQLSLVNSSTTADGTAPAEVFFDRTATGSGMQGSVGFDPARGLYARVNGADRLSISTGGDTSLTGRLTAPSVNNHQLGNFLVSSFGYGNGTDYVGWGNAKNSGLGASAMLARNDGTVYINSGSGTGNRITLENMGNALISMDASGNWLPATDASQTLGGSARWGTLNVVNVACTGTLYYGANQTPLAAISTSGSASDLIKGVCPLSTIPNLPANLITSGTFLFANGANAPFASNVVPATNNAVSLGTSSLQWSSAYVASLTASSSILAQGSLTCNGNITAIDASGNISTGTGIVKATMFATNFANTQHTFGSSSTGAGLTGSNISNLDSTLAQWRHQGVTANATPVTAAFCLQHSQSGATVLNALSGQVITLSNNNSPQVTVGLNAILPANNLAVALGTASQRFMDCYAHNLNLSGSASMVQTLVVTSNSSGATVARFNGAGGSGNVSNIDFSSFSDGSSPSWRWTQTDAGNNLATLKLQRTIGGGNSASMTDVITYNTDSSVTLANYINVPSVRSLANTSYFDGKVSQLVNDKNYTVNGSNISQFNNDKNYTTNGSNVSQFNNDKNYTVSGSNVSQFNNDKNYTTSGSNVSQFNNDSGYVKPYDSPSFTNITATNSLLMNNTCYINTGGNGAAAIFQPSSTSQTNVEIKWVNPNITWALGIGSGTGSFPNDFGLFSSQLGSAAIEVSSANAYVTMKKGYGTSDARLKQDIADLPHGLEVVRKLRPVEYRWKSGEDRRKHWGLIAQDLQTALPEGTAIVQEREYLSVAYDDLTSLLIKAVQEQQAALEKLQEKVAALEKHHV